MPGPAKKSASLHRLAGTRSKGVKPDAEVLPEVDPATIEIPPAPEWMPNPFAVTEWNRLARFMAVRGMLNDGNFGALAVACAMHGTMLQDFAAGRAPLAATWTQHSRAMVELGLTGSQKPGGVAPAEKTNRFAANGRRPAAA